MAVNFEASTMSTLPLIKLLLLIITSFKHGETAKLSVPRILLPYNTGVPTNYTLEVKEGGCYKWSSSRYDLVSVTALPSERERVTCTTKAVVSAVSRYPERENAIVLAEDEKSGQVLRCDVVIDSLRSVEIITTTRVLFLEDAPEAFEVVAKNDQGDTFSSLAGVAFQWSLESESTASDAYGVLRFLKFSDSVYKTPPTIEYWEKRNLHGSMVLMEGSKTGSAKVTVKPHDAAYKHVLPYNVSLVVVANLNLKPAHISLLPDTNVKFHLELIKQGKVFPIPLPSDQYYLEIIDRSVATLDEAVSVVTGLKYGTTNIVVKDRYITGREIAYLPSAVINVTPPSYLTLSVSPGDKWSLEENKNYSVSVSVYDRNSHPIHLTEDIRVQVNFPSKFFKVTKHTSNGTFQEVKTLVPGSCLIIAHLLGVFRKDGSIKEIEPSISSSQDVIIYESVKVHPAQTLLPWDPIVKPVYSIFLKGTGGTGTFNWMSGDSSLASVHAMYEQEESIARVSTFGLGTFHVHAIDAHIPAFTGSGQVSIQPVVELTILPEQVEVELDEMLVLPVAMYGIEPGTSTMKMFNNCSEVSLNIDIDDIQKFSLANDIASKVKPNACRNIHLHCATTGFNRIRIKYEREAISLKRAVIAACYKKLKVINPTSELLLAVGTALDVIFEGGPRPWPRCQTHFMDIDSSIDFIDVSVLRNESELSDVHKVNAFCRNYGENTFTLKVGNNPCESNRHPAVNEAHIKILCAVPESIILRPILPTIQGRKCPAPVENRIAIHTTQALELELIVKDSNGREFLNISSFNVKWHLSDTILAHFSSYEGTKMKLTRQKDMQLKPQYFQELNPNGKEGVLKASASILGYKKNIPNLADSIYEERFTAINTSLNFKLVEEAVVEPKKVSVFNSPSSKIFLNITKGSGYFQVEASDHTKAKVTYKPSTRQIEVIPLETGSLTITLVDLCLGLVHDSVAQVQIYGISAIKVDILDKVQLGNTITAAVEVLNEEKENIPASVFGLINLQPAIVSDHISVRLNTTERHQYQAFYTIKGLSLGHTNLKIVAKANIFKGVQLESDSYPIQVFPPLILNPSHIVLIVGATFQVLCSGGPQPQTNIEYLIEPKDIAVVSVAGIVEAKKIGKTTLTAKSSGVDKHGNSAVYSEDKITIDCVSLNEIRIHSPLSRMIAGTEMPLYAMGVSEHENPFAFGTAYPAAQFRWSVSNDKVASLQSLYNNVGLQETSDNNFRVGLKAHQDGLVTVHLEVTLPKESSLSFFGGTQVLTAESQIQVFTKLRLMNPEVDDGLIIMSLGSQMKLKCNRFGAAKLSYEILAATQPSVVSIDESGNLIAASKSGSAVLRVTAVEEFGVTQRLSLTVLVEEIAFMMLKPMGKIMTRDWPLSVLPVGFTVPFVVTYHNSIGQVFHAVRSQLHYRASRHNSARVSFGSTNNTLSVQVVKPGFTVLKVWDLESSIPSDYVKIITGTAIDPPDVQITVGDVMCFGSPLITQEGHSGSWSSSKKVISIHPLSGGAIALSPGITVVSYSLKNGFSTSTQVTVHEASHISIESGHVHHLSNLARSKPYKIYIIVHGAKTQKVNNIVGKNCSSATESSMPLPLVQHPFTCELSFIGSSADMSASDLFYSSSGFDIEKGMYYCSIDPVNRIAPNEISNLEGQVSLTVHLLSGGHSASLSEQVLFSFLPAFYIQQSELVLSDIQNVNNIVISATAVVQKCILVVPNDSTILKVRSPIVNPTYPASITFPIELRDINYLWKGELQSLYIEISCPISKQLVKIPIKVKRMEVPMDGIIRWFTSARKGVVTSQPVFLHHSHSSSNGSHVFSSPGAYGSYPPSPFQQRFSPQNITEDYGNITQPLRLCSLDTSTSPKTMRRRSDNVFR